MSAAAGSGGRSRICNKLVSIFGGVKIREIDGYFVFEAVRRRAEYANRSKRKS